MQEKSLKIYASEKTFFNKLTNTLTKLLMPTRVGINGMLISMKRNNVIKAYEHFVETSAEQDVQKRDAIVKKQEDCYTLYLEAIDKYVMDSIYKKVKNGAANEFEKEALAQYYTVVHLKETEYLEYKYKKQQYLLELDYETIQGMEKSKLMEKYRPLYISKMDGLYKGILKNYSIKLADNLTPKNKEEIYQKIFALLEEYITKILPLKMEQEDEKSYQEIVEQYDKLERFTVGKLDQRDFIEKNMLLLGISRSLFTHSLPLIVAEQCYVKLLKDTRNLIVDTKISKKQEKAYDLLINLIEDYNIRLLSTKVYWDKPSQRDAYKKFWKEYQDIEKLKETDFIEYLRRKEALFVKNDLKAVYTNENRYYKIIQFYKAKLVELGEMKQLKNTCTTYGSYRKIK